MSISNSIISRRSNALSDLIKEGFDANSFEGLLQVIYQHRGVRDKTELNYQLAGLASPAELKGIDAAVELLVDALRDDQHIVIVGDFDADGATSSALAVLALKAMGHQKVDYLVPNRFKYGYGLTPEIVIEAHARYPDIALIVTVDNGIASLDGVDQANELGISVLITDHHLPAEQLPLAAAIVNPNQPGCQFSSKNMAGVGVVFYVMSRLRAQLRNKGWFTQHNLPEPNMANFLDLVALGTVADVVPLDSLNRTLVYQGLQRIRAGACRPGISALLQAGGRSQSRLVASDLGFALGPRLNAAGRLDDMSLGIECLMTDDPGLARDIAMQLDDLNSDRKAIESGMQREALDSLQKLDFTEEAALPWGLCLYQEGWHQGVIGILASRIKDRYHRPTIAFAAAGNGLLKGSARSIPGFHIRDALDLLAKRYPNLLQKFGGHAMAAGMTISAVDYPAFCAAFNEIAKSLLTEQELTARILSDGELPLALLDIPFADALQEAGPWGQHFPEPVFDGEFYIVQQRIVGQKHLKLVLSSEPNSQQLIDAIAFNVEEGIWPDPQIQRVRIAYQLTVNEFRGRRSPQLLVNYIKPC